MPGDPTASAAGKLPSPLKQLALWYLPAAVAGAVAQTMTAYAGVGLREGWMALLGGACMFGAAGILLLVFTRYGRDLSEPGRRRANQLRGVGFGSLVGGYLLSPAGALTGGPDAALIGGLLLTGVLGWVFWLEREWRMEREGTEDRR